MEKKQEQQWMEAQRIAISEDLIEAALRQVEFLKAVDRRREIYDGPYLQKAIHRYKYCWLPFLAAQSNEFGGVKGPLVVPLDCEWIWHCHRLNPIQYSRDCMQLYGKLLDSRNVVSSLEASSAVETEELWAKQFPHEPFELKRNSHLDVSSVTEAEVAGGITYDLVAAVQRQSSFCYQISRPCMTDARFLKAALARYKGFLYLIKSNQDLKRDRFCVPTYDVDLMWHSHQLHPQSYGKDMRKLLGRVLQHDDMDSDRSKGQKLDVGFNETTRQWEETFGTRYRRAGVLYRGSAPQTLKHASQFSSGSEVHSENSLVSGQKYISLPTTQVVQVLLEVVDARNLPIGVNKEDLSISFVKPHDIFFSGEKTTGISSVTWKENVVEFDCEPAGEFILTLVARKANQAAGEIIGSVSVHLQELGNPDLPPSMEKWFELKQQQKLAQEVPVGLRVAVSCTVPVHAPHELSMKKVTPFPLKNHSLTQWTKDQEHGFGICFVDNRGMETIRLQLRESRIKNTVKQEVIGIPTLLKKPIVLADYLNNQWTLKDFDLVLPDKIKLGADCCIFELEGSRPMKLLWGKRLDFGPCDLAIAITAVEFSAEHPYGKAIALLDIAAQSIKVNEDWFALPWITLVFIIITMFEKEGENITKGLVQQTELVKPQAGESGPSV